jgi:hypothetical protein
MDFIKETATDLTTEKPIVRGTVPKRGSKKPWSLYRLNVTKEGILLAETFGFTNTYMILLSPDGEEIAKNNDLDRGKTCSRIAVGVGVGEYYLVVHEHRANAGPFGLIVRGCGYPVKIDEDLKAEVMAELEEVQVEKEKERWKKTKETRLRQLTGTLEDGKWSGKVDTRRRQCMLLAKIDKAGKYRIVCKSKQRFTFMLNYLAGPRITYFQGQNKEGQYVAERVMELKKEDYWIQVYLYGAGDVEVEIKPVEPEGNDY